MNRDSSLCRRPPTKSTVPDRLPSSSSRLNTIARVPHPGSASRSNSLAVSVSRLTPHPERPVGGVELASPLSPHASPICRWLGVEANAPQLRLDPRHELTRTERLHHVVVRANAPGPPMRSASSARAVNRMIGERSRAWRRSERHTSRPSKPGQHHVEHDEMRRLALHEPRSPRGRRRVVTTRKPSRARYWPTTSRTVGSSSTTSTVRAASTPPLWRAAHYEAREFAGRPRAHS